MKGQLKETGIKKYGLKNEVFSQCQDCGTEFIHNGLTAFCNGKYITMCPWCRSDSKPWTNGRGS